MNWNKVSNLSSILTIIGFIFPIITFILGMNVNKIKRFFRKRRALKNIEDAGVLIIGINQHKNPEIAVKKYLKKNSNLKNIEKDKIHIILLADGDFNIEKRKIENIRTKLRNKLREMDEQGIRIKHLFLMCPVSIAAIIGAELSNIGKTFIYQQNQENYEIWGDLSKY